MILKMNLLILGATLFYAASQIGEVDGVLPPEICGLYRQAANYSMDDMNKYIEAMGYAPERALKIYGQDKDKGISVYNAGKDWIITIIASTNDLQYQWKIAFQSRRTFNATFLDDRKIESVARVNLDAKIPSINCVFTMDGFDAFSDYNFMNNGLILTMKAKQASVDLRFERMQ